MEIYLKFLNLLKNQINSIKIEKHREQGEKQDMLITLRQYLIKLFCWSVVWDESFKYDVTVREKWKSLPTRIITLCLRHRLRKDPLESVDSGFKVQETFKKVFGYE